MRTTLDVPDHLFRRAKKHAAEEGVTLRALVLRALEAQLGARKARGYKFGWRVVGGGWNRDLPLHSREALEDYLGSWRPDLYG